MVESVVMNQVIEIGSLNCVGKILSSVKPRLKGLTNS